MQSHYISLLYKESFSVKFSGDETAGIYKEHQSKYPSFFMKSKNWNDYSGL